MKGKISSCRYSSLVIVMGVWLSGCSGGASGDGSDTPGGHMIFPDAVSAADTSSVATSDGSSTPNPQSDVVGRVPPNLAPELDPGCIDGKYTETLPTPTADISDLVAAYDSGNAVTFIVEVLTRRYPVGAAALEGGHEAKNSGFGGSNCIDQFLHQKDTASQVISSLSTLVHECGHAYDISLGGFSGAAYFFTPETQLICQGGSIPDFGGKTFARSLINGDEYAALHTPCAQFRDQNCDDSYAALYLDGDPDNGQFESGDQGFDMLFEEIVQYVNSLATDYAFNDHVTGWISARDGILTFLWYLERYLRMARLEHPTAYAHLTGDACWREAILTVWGRAWLYLELTENMANLGIDDDKLIGLVRAPELLEEIQRIRDAEGCSP